MWLGLVVDGHWFVVAVLGDSVMGGRFVGGYYITDLVGFLGDLGNFFIAGGAGEGVIRLVLSALSLPRDGLTGVVASALVGTWVFCDRFGCIFPGRVQEGSRYCSKVTGCGTIALHYRFSACISPLHGAYLFPKYLS